MKHMMIIFLAILLMACTGSSITLAIDSRFTDHEIEIIKSAADEWLEATDSGDAMVFFSDHFYYDTFTKDEWETNLEYGLLFKISTTDQGYIDLVEDRGSHFTGLANNYTGNVALRTDVISEDYILRRTMIHELGHLFGLEHSNVGVMVSDSKLGEGSDCVHAMDLVQFCEDNYCGPDLKSTCDY